jgi:hypothetical protein
VPRKAKNTDNRRAQVRQSDYHVQWCYDVDRAARGVVFDVGVRMRSADGTFQLSVAQASRMFTARGPWLLEPYKKLIKDDWEVYAWRTRVPPPYPGEQE